MAQREIAGWDYDEALFGHVGADRADVGVGIRGRRPLSGCSAAPEGFSWTGVYVGVSAGVSDGVSSADVSYANHDPDVATGPNGSFSNGMYSSQTVVGNFINDYSVLPAGYEAIVGGGQSSVGSLTGIEDVLYPANTPLTSWLTSVGDGDIGVAGSVRVGANYQVGNVVLGVEADGSLLDQKTEINRSISESATLDVSQIGDDVDGVGVDLNYDYSSVYDQDGEFRYSAEVSNLITARGRIGFAADRTLFFLTGGLAAGEVRQSTRANVSEWSENTNQGNIGNNTASGVNAVNNNVSWSGSDSEMKYGYAVGGGFSHAITDNVILTVDGYYYDLGKHSVTAVDNYGETSYTVSQKFDGYVARGGVEYKF